jgi:hypothetical protein
MSAGDVVELLAVLEQQKITVWIDGGSIED